MKKKVVEKINKYICVTMGFVLFFSGVLYYEDTALTTNTHVIKNDKLPEVFDDFKILQISDFHNTKNKLLTEQIIRKINDEKPNAIFITGDLIDANTPDVDVAIEMIMQIKEIAPIYYVPGNHEGHFGDYNSLKEKLLDCGVTVLDNDVRTIEKKGENINIIGAQDPIFSNARQNNKAEKMRENLDGINYNKDNFTILLSHRPELLYVYAEYDIDLVFSGHAHGGQIRIPYIGGLYAPGQGSLPKLTSGMHQKENTSMIISRGIGNSTFPFRINNHPELVIVKLESDTK